MHQRQWLRAVSMLSCFAWALAAQEAPQAPAPTDIKPGQVIHVPAHRSKWDYPKEVTLPEGCQLHVVEKGDTLWDLGNKYLGNPFAWPQIWELNKWITDPHWIYPMDHLLIPTGRQTIAQTGETPAEVISLQPDRKRIAAKPVQDEYAFTFQDFIQMPYLAPKGASEHFKQIHAVKIADRRAQEKSLLGEGENIYLDSGSAKGLQKGDRLLILKVIKKDLYHPKDVRRLHDLGDVIKQVGVARITQIDPKSSVAIIEKAMDAIEVGDHLAPFSEPANVTLKLRTDIDEPVRVQAPLATVTFVADNHDMSGSGEMLIIDKGTKDGFKVGDVVLIVSNQSWPVGKKETGKTTNYLGQALVIKADSSNATCRVLRAQQELHVGDQITH